jgi:DNA-binding response OmpR family regulator
MAHILIAEDERDIRELIMFTLTFAGHKITQASNGEEALEMAQQISPDMIMTDVRMPKMTGYQLCRALRELPQFANTPIVILSAKGQDEEVEEGRESGATDYILKPFAPDRLTQRVAEILAKAGIA